MKILFHILFFSFDNDNYKKAVHNNKIKYNAIKRQVTTRKDKNEI